MADPERLRELSVAQEPRAGIIDTFFLKPGSDVTEILLIRHAQVPEGIEEDRGLTETGLEQAEALADFLASSQVAAVYASPALRARQTAAPLARQLGLEVTVNDALRDVEPHLPPGLSMREALLQEFGAEEANRRISRTPLGMSFDTFGPLMESSEALRQRLTGGIDGIVAAHPGQRVAVVSHGPSIATYVAHLLDVSTDFFFFPRLTSISVILARGDERQVRILNATPHFAAL